MRVLSVFRRPVEWFLITGKRRFVAVVLFVLVSLFLVSLGFFDPSGMRDLLSEQNIVESLFNTLLSGIILLVSIVVSINSLVVSQELTPIGDQYERITDSWEFRQRTASEFGSNETAARPGIFLSLLVKGIGERLDSIEIPDELEDETHQDFEAFVEETYGALEHTSDLFDSKTGSLAIELFRPQYDPTEFIDRAHQLQDGGTALSEENNKQIDEVVDALQYFATAREYFKTIYYKREFSYLSRDLLYTGLPSILFISYVLLAVNAESFTGMTLGIDNLVLFLGLSYAIALTPFIVLTAYVLRTAVIAEQTTASGGFIIGERSHRPLASQQLGPDDADE